MGLLGFGDNESRGGRSQYDTTIIAGESRRHSDGGLGMGALLRCAAIWLALAFAFAAALVPVTARAQQKITFANARTVTVTVTVGKSQDVHTEILNDQGFSYMLRGDYTRAHKKLEEARAKDPANPYVQANLQLLEESYHYGRAIQ